ncbi:MAG: hypothetical protein Q9164_004210 [Protoblastenia rupestris]
MDPNMDPKKRLQINFQGYNTDRNFQPSNDRVFPTTPSTFPQPVFGNAGGSTPNANAYANNHAQSPYGNQAGGYFSQYSQPQQPMSTYQNQGQGQYQNQFQGQNLAAPQPAYQQRQNGYNMNDPTSPLAHQFANQNLGAPQRQGSPFGRQASPNARLYSNNQQAGLQQSRGQQNVLTPPAQDTAGRSLSPTIEEPPEKNPDRYSSNIVSRGQNLHAFVETFFKENITRARERNKRAREVDADLQNPSLSDFQKKQRVEATRRAEAGYLRYLRHKERPQNFSTLKIIGKGAFGEVRLVTRKSDGKIYALKSLIKTEMFKKDQLAHVRAERDILAESDSPWVVKLHNTFQDNAYLYMLMEFLPGGDLMTMLIRYEIFSLSVTRFYMAEIIMAIEEVHKHGYIHRDIKPDNILLDRNGHVKLTDFGLSTGFRKAHENTYYQELMNSKDAKKKQQNRNSVSLDQINLTMSNHKQINTWRKSRRELAYSTVGTPDYIAPEIFTGRGYSFSCDWWSVGAIMFECLIGWPPFCAEDAHDTYKKILDWRSNLYFPPDNPLLQDAQGRQQWPAAEDCIKRLLCDVQDRMGTSFGQSGSQELKAHPFFTGVQWHQLRQIRAPFLPQLSSNVDTTYFPIGEIDQSDTTAQTRAQVDHAMKEGEGLNAEMSLPFIGYTYKRFDAMRS